MRTKALQHELVRLRVGVAGQCHLGSLPSLLTSDPRKAAAWALGGVLGMCLTTPALSGLCRRVGLLTGRGSCFGPQG